ncbi:M3 family oligoendopeptidase [Evansella halocellulosilytica]|uniref:M3 family oligoendopeptidase n=1 Tax=Evansella halocellulosilytica TaxID=2011013 RepID=UPI000BB856E3|nr:M3 family oligoendopeptidase [Evansella halocellulosilytica]
MTKFYVEKFNFQQPQEIEKKYEELLAMPVETVEELTAWLKEESLISDEISEGLSGHYIDFQCQSDSEEAKKAFEYDQKYILPIVKRFDALLDDKFLSSPAKDHLDQSYYDQFIRSKQNSKELFREENVELEIEEDRLSTNYFEHTGGLTVDWNGEEKTISQLQEYLEDSNREVRKAAVEKIAKAFLTKKDELQHIMTELIELREKKAKNAGLANYRDYMFKKYERFDYTPDDCKNLADAIRKHVKPLKEKQQRQRQKEIGVDVYRPWDVRAVPLGQKPLKPFSHTSELVEKSAAIFENLDPRFAELIRTMDERRMLDLDSRKGKSPGGFCDSLPVSKLSFIFMNAANSHDDMITLLHEMGHCIHNDLKTTLPLSLYRDTPMESAELASMSMELMTMDQWDRFYENEADLIRAKKDQLEGIIDFLPHGVIIDQFQHWLYENPDHTAEERNEKFYELTKSIDSNVVDWSGHEEWLKHQWHKVLHIFEVPFYYIDYVIAQLGAVQMYKQYCDNPTQALKNYKKALSLGSSKSLSEVYEAAGIQFDFSEKMIKELMEFIEKKLAVLN